MRRKLTLASAVLGLALHVPAWALGLGQLEQRSALNEPLSARIPLTSVSLDERESMVVTLASAEAYRRAGVERPFSLASLNFEVVNQQGGRPYIRVTTQRPVREPFLNFLVEVSWNSGRMVRQYTLLLDPPVYGAERQPPAAAAQAPARRSASSRADETPASATTGGARPAADRSRGVAEVAGGERGDYRVQNNDTLWAIAREVRPDDSVTVHQTMVALFEENPRAFINQDMNRLRRGAILRVPSAERIAVGRDQARQVVSDHVSRWRASQQAAAPAASDNAPATAGNDGEGGNQARLEIVAPAADDAGGGDASLFDQELAPSEENLRRLQNQLGLVQEQSASLESENSELEAQVGSLRTEVERLERLIELQVAQGLNQDQPAASPATGSAETDDMAEAADGPGAGEPKDGAESPTQAQTPSPAATPVQPEPAPQPSIWQDTRILGALGAAIVAVLGLLFVALRRRRGEDADGGAVELGEIQHEDAGQPAAAAEAVEEPAAVASGYDEGDVLDGLEVYLAYGRYEQAREAVEAVIAAEPARSDLRVKLLEIMALMDDRGGFEAQAQTLYGMLGDSTDPEWQKVAEMGRAIAPENPLFADESIDNDQPLVSDELAEPLFDEDDTALAATEASEPEPEPEPVEPEPVLDAEPAEEPEPADESAERAGLQDLEFDLGGFGDEAAAAPQEPEPTGAAEADGFELDFDLDSKDSDADTALEAETDRLAEEAAPEDGGLSFDTGAEAAEAPDEDLAFPSGDEMETKLDLAQAYLDMGDADGARELLTEVLDEADGEHKQRAQALLDQV